MGLSSNVMNMKFMQKALDKTKSEVQPEGKKVKDVSEWLIPSGSIKPKIKPTVTINSVGYGSIASLTAQDEESDSEETSKPKTTPLPEQSWDSR
ncbi:M-phase phosphoprotein 6 [Metschnikowia aff. pulcherrima]|uniref:M-phase phosphoprotein 6 n=1 Tax=Metschnikowia aff. pulcherrima TaxID=2163413 RepID=A0A4P6XR36_9ASCO|nr:M-phase phosphoprotein 6 [Metschnikowia aff. pulcherrima]